MLETNNDYNGLSHFGDLLLRYDSVLDDNFYEKNNKIKA